MHVDGKTLKIQRNLWAQYGGVSAKAEGDELLLTGEEEDGYLKVFNHFGRLLKLYTFENGSWVDADSGGPPIPFDEAQAGHLPGNPPLTKPVKAKAKPTAKKSAPKKKPAAAKAAKATPQTAKKSVAKTAAKASPKRASAKITKTGGNGSGKAKASGSTAGKGKAK